MMPLTMPIASPVLILEVSDLNTCSDIAGFGVAFFPVLELSFVFFVGVINGGDGSSLLGAGVAELETGAGVTGSVCVELGLSVRPGVGDAVVPEVDPDDDEVSFLRSSTSYEVSVKICLNRVRWTGSAVAMARKRASGRNRMRNGIFSVTQKGK